MCGVCDGTYMSMMKWVGDNREDRGEASRCGSFCRVAIPRENINRWRRGPPRSPPHASLIIDKTHNKCRHAAKTRALAAPRTDENVRCCDHPPNGIKPLWIAWAGAIVIRVALLAGPWDRSAGTVLHCPITTIISFVQTCPMCLKSALSFFLSTIETSFITPHVQADPFVPRNND